MAVSNYPACLSHILRYEGGYVDHPSDPGGATNMGITIGTLSRYRGEPVTKSDVRNLSEAEAAAIYRRRYWNVVKGDFLPGGLDLVAFDGAVNSGPSRGAKWLQRGLRVTADGKIGPKTLDAAEAADGVAVIKRACAARMGFLKRLRTFSVFGRGWSKRVASVEATAVAMYTQGAATLERGRAQASKDAKAATTAATGSGLGGGGLGLTDIPNLPDWLVYVGIALLAVAVVAAVRKAGHHRNRVTAYADALREFKNG